MIDRLREAKDAISLACVSLLCSIIISGKFSLTNCLMPKLS